MTAEQADKLVQSIYDGIFDSITKAEPGSKPLMPASTTVLSMTKPGMVINPKDFKNQWTPGNRDGSTEAAKNTADLVDVIPAMSGIYTDNGNRISQVYNQILESVFIPAQDTAAADKQLANAHQYLYRTVNVTDPDTGEVEVNEIESKVYRSYLDNEAAYMAQRMAYVAAYQAAQNDPAQKGIWPLIAPTLQIPVKSAYDKWRSNYADKVEEKLAIMETSTRNALQKAFKKGRDLMEGYGVVLDESGSGMGPLTYRTNLLPSDWYSPKSASKWISKKVSENNYSLSSTSEYTRYGGSAGFSLGIFSIGGSAGHSKTHRHVSRETRNLSFEYEYTLVTIRRPWMIFNLLGTKGWNLGNLYSKGQISNGAKTGQEDSVWPLLPTSFVAVKNVKISANWSKSDWDYLKKQTHGGGGVGIGPFRIGGSYSHSESKFTSSFDDAKGEILVPGVQIIGWINQIVPYCPPANQTARAAGPESNKKSQTAEV